MRFFKKRANESNTPGPAHGIPYSRLLVVHVGDFADAILGKGGVSQQQLAPKL